MMMMMMIMMMEASKQASKEGSKVGRTELKTDVRRLDTYISFAPRKLVQLSPVDGKYESKNSMSHEVR